TSYLLCIFFFFQAEDGIRDWSVTGVQTCALPISPRRDPGVHREVALRVLRNARGDLRARRRGERPPVAREAHVDVTGAERERHEIGRASCRERVWRSVVAVAVKKKYRGGRRAGH